MLALFWSLELLFCHWFIRNQTQGRFVFSDVAKGMLIPSGHHEKAQALRIGSHTPSRECTRTSQGLPASQAAGREQSNEENTPNEGVVQRVPLVQKISQPWTVDTVCALTAWSSCQKSFSPGQCSCPIDLRHYSNAASCKEQTTGQSTVQ